MRKELNDGMMDFLASKNINAINKITPLKNILRYSAEKCEGMEPGRLSKGSKAFSGEYEPKIFSNKEKTKMELTKKEVRVIKRGRVLKSKFGRKVKMGAVQIVKKAEIVKAKPTKFKKVPVEARGTYENFGKESK